MMRSKGLDQPTANSLIPEDIRPLQSHQHLPVEIADALKSIWFLRWGRGSGKTYTGATHTAIYVLTYPGVEMGVVARTKRDLKKINFNDNLLRLIPENCISDFNQQDMILELTNGSILSGFTGQKPDGLRGSNLNGYWVDELPAYQYPEETMKMLTYATRKVGFGSNIPILKLITTTPRPTQQIKDLCSDPDTHETVATPYDNRANLSEDFFKEIDKTKHTRLGRQEIMAEILEDIGALWTKDVINRNRLMPDGDGNMPVLPKMDQIVIAVDPAVTGNLNSAYTGIVVVGKSGDKYYVIADLSMQGKPHEWAEAVVDAYHDYDADWIIAEVNNGGDLVEEVIRSVDVGNKLHYKAVRASRGKIKRADPVGSLYELNKVHHVGQFADLEWEMCNFTGQASDASPDRMDALVWGMTHLLDWSGEEIVGGFF